MITGVASRARMLWKTLNPSILGSIRSRRTRSGLDATNARDATREEKRTNARSSRTGVGVKLMNTRYGRVLFDGEGRALYLFTRERTGRSRCYGDCASAWPSFLTKGRPRARSGVKSS